MKDSSPNRFPWGQEKKDPPYIEDLAKMLHKDPAFQAECDLHGIDNVHISERGNAVRIQCEGYPPSYKNTPPAFVIYSPRTTDDSSYTYMTDEIILNVKDMLHRFLTHPVDTAILMNDDASDLTLDYTTDDDEKILYFVENLYTGEKMLRYEWHHSAMPAPANSTNETRSWGLREWLKIRKQVQKEHYEKKVVAYWWNSGVLHLITEDLDREEEGVWEGAKNDSSKDVGMIVLIESMHRILEENGLEKDVTVYTFEQWSDGTLENVCEHLWLLQNDDGDAMRLLTDMNGRIINDEKDIETMVRRLQEDIADNGQLLALILVPALEEDEDVEMDNEDWKRTGTEYSWNIEVHKVE